MTTFRGCVQAMRWDGLRALLYEAATLYGVAYRTVEESKGLLTHTVYFEVQGERPSIERFFASLKLVIEPNDGA